MKTKSILFGLMFLMYVPLLTGCEMKDPIIKEMESAYLVAYNQKNDTFVERDAAVSRAVQKHFPLGMKAEDALKLLNDLQKQGFVISELKYEGTRIWPNKEFRQDRDGNVNREKHYPHGTTGYSAMKKYATFRLIFTKTAVISIKLDNNGNVVESQGHINISGI